MFGVFVATGSAASALNDDHLRQAWPGESRSEVLTPMPGVKLARFVPKDSTCSPGFTWSDDRKVVVGIDGYLLTDRAPDGSGQAEHARSFANLCREEGYAQALRSIVAGAFNLVVADLEAQRCYVSNDHVGSLSVYHSRLDDGWLLSSNPVALARTGLVDTEADLTGMTEWIYLQQTIGERFVVRGIRILLPYTSLHWDSEANRGHLQVNPDPPMEIDPERVSPSPDDLVDAFLEGCQRIASIDPQPAHLQSSGKDSRLILASWPTEEPLPCYTYGNPDSLEVHIARQVADLRGADWIHIWMDGDQVAPDLESMFNANGQIIWPDRFLAARQMLKDGYSGVLDGYCGGFMTHMNNGYGSERFFTLLPKIARRFAIFRDVRVSAVGLEAFANAVWNQGLELPDEGSLRELVTADFFEALKDEKANVLQDIQEEAQRVMPGNDSVATLWRNYHTVNRGTRSVAQQGVMCRCFVNVYTPYSADVPFFRLMMKVRPEDAAFERLTIRMYRKRFPDYGKIVYGDSLVPMTSSPFRHKLSSLLIARDKRIPWLSGNAQGKPRDANSWFRWLQESAPLREAAAGFLRQGGIIDEENSAQTFERMAAGQAQWGGKLFHLAAMGKWLSLSGSPAGGGARD
jgi:hypothetical protein